MTGLPGRRAEAHILQLYMTYIVYSYRLEGGTVTVSTVEPQSGPFGPASWIKTRAAATEWTQTFPSDQESKQLQRFSSSDPNLKPAP